MDFKQLPQYLLLRHTITQLWYYIKSSISNDFKFYYIEFVILEQSYKTHCWSPLYHKLEYLYRKNMYKFLLSSIFLSIT